MKYLLTFFIVLITVCGDEYKLGVDSKPKDGVPKGKVTHHVWKSKVIEGTIRHYSFCIGFDLFYVDCYRSDVGFCMS